MESVDSVLSQFDENQSFPTDSTSIKDIIQRISQSNEKYLFESEFLSHRLFLILRDYYLNLLQKWHYGEQLDESSGFIFETIPNLFLKISNQISETNLSILKELILYKPILDEFNLCLEQIALNGKLLQDPQIKSLDYLFRAIQRLERNRLDNKIDEPLLIKLYDNIVRCICSSSFMETFLLSITQENDDPGQKFLLHTCIDYIYSHPIDQQYKQSLVDIRESQLGPFSQWLNQQSSFSLWNTRMSIKLRQICFLFTLSIQHNRYLNLQKQIFDYYCQLIDSFLNIFYSINQTDHVTNNNKLAQSLLETLTSNLYTMILSNQLEKYLKNKSITLLILKLAEFDNDEIQLNIFRILSIIVTEQDMKNTSNSTNLIHLFIKFLSKIIDDSNQILRFYNLLQCLQSLIHSDQLKDELTKQNGIPLLVRCITETKFKPLQVQQPALEILLALTFNKQAYQQLKQSLHSIKLLLSSPHQSILQTVECLLWRLEKQDEQISSQPQTSNNFYQYNLMISYSHSDKELVNRIYDRLMQDNIRVWIDHNETFGTPIITKANLMKQSEYILICMSDQYKQNCYCRLEAYYASESQYQIIPIILSTNSYLDGWLIEITNGKIYIDFSKLDFDLAYKTLKNEVKPSIYSNIEQISVLPRIEYTSSLPKTEQFSSFPIQLEYPSNLKQWTVDDVKRFLIGNNFNCLLDVILGMDGCLLYDLYSMCLDHRESMYHTLKNELLILNKNPQSLTLFIYLKFLREIQKYIPTTI